MQDARDVLRQYVRNEINAWDIYAWAHSILEIKPDGHEVTLKQLIDLFDQPTCPGFELKVESLIASIAAPHEPYIGERFRAIHLIERVLQRNATPIELFSLIESIGTNWPDDDPTPDWVTELWNNLDWCDDDWSLDNQPHLSNALETMLAKLKSLDQDHSS